jgi:hypothetical protein
MTDNARGTRRAVTETDLELGDGRTLHVYDTGVYRWNLKGVPRQGDLRPLLS